MSSGGYLLPEVLLADVVFIAGTDTGVGKTVVTAAVASVLADAGGRELVEVHKLVQAGPSDTGLSDAVDVGSMVGGAVSSCTHTTLSFPMAPRAAAAREGVSLPDVEVYVEAVARAADSQRFVVVEGSGGLLVELDEHGKSVADVACGLVARGVSVSVVVVCRSGLGTQNHAALTVEALARRGLDRVGLVVGSLEADPDEVVLSNLEYLRGLGPVFLGCVPAGASRLSVAAFRDGARGWLST